MKELNIFDYLDAIFTKKEIKYDEKIAPPYLLVMWLSHENNLIKYLEPINKGMWNIKPELIWEYLYNSIPKRKNKFIKWVKKTKKKEIKEELINDLSEKYNISFIEVKKIIY